MSKRSLSLGGVLVLAILAGVAWYMNGGSSTKAVTSDPNLACHVYEEPKKDVSAAPAVPMLKENKAPAYKVLKVTDGDTITIAKDGETKVRFLGMDAPEKSTTRYGHSEYYGEEAYAYALKLIEASGNQVRVTYDKAKQDQYGRDLAYVWLKDGRLLNAVLVADGYAYYYQGSPKPQYADTFLALMRSARSANKGVWAHCQ
jgi:micrococcal nuclease